MLRGPPLFILAIIALAFALACPVSGSAQEPIRAEGAAGNLHKDAHPLVIHHPTTFVCVPPSGTGEQRQPIPPGKPIEDLCPPGSHAYLFHDPGPFVRDIPPPVRVNAAGPQEPTGAPSRESGTASSEIAPSREATERNLHKSHPDSAKQSP